jgi:MFS family permease
MLPLMLGVLIASIGSGQLITRYGRYKVFPIIGTGVMFVGMLLLSRLSTGTNLVLASFYMLVVGLGLGFVMQVLVLAVQNAVGYSELGVATASATLFRSMGGTIGVPLFGAIFSNRLATELADRLPAGARIPAHAGPSQLDALPPAIRDPYIAAYAAALRPIFLLAAAVALVGFAVTWFLQELPLRQTVADQSVGDSFAAPREQTSIEELETRLSALAQKENRHQVYDRLIERAGLEIDAPEAWLLLGIYSVESGARVYDPDVEPILERLRAAGLVEPDTAQLTAAGQDAAAKMAAVRYEQLRAFVEEWQPEQHPEVLEMVDRLSKSLSTSPPVEEPVPVASG